MHPALQRFSYARSERCSWVTLLYLAIMKWWVAPDAFPGRCKPISIQSLTHLHEAPCPLNFRQPHISSQSCHTVLNILARRFSFLWKCASRTGPTGLTMVISAGRPQCKLPLCQLPTLSHRYEGQVCVSVCVCVCVCMTRPTGCSDFYFCSWQREHHAGNHFLIIRAVQWYDPSLHAQWKYRWGSISQWSCSMILCSWYFCSVVLHFPYLTCIVHTLLSLVLHRKLFWSHDYIHNVMTLIYNYSKSK